MCSGSSSIASGRTRRAPAFEFLNGWIDALQWQRLPEMDRLGEFLLKHVDDIAAYCDHPVRFGASSRSIRPSRPPCVGHVECETR